MGYRHRNRKRMERIYRCRRVKFVFHFITSPIGSEKLKIEWVDSFNPEEKSYVKISLAGKGDDYITIRPISDFSVHVYWGDTIKIRGGVLVEADTTERLLNWRQNYSSSEELEVLSDKVRWKHYYLNELTR